MDWFLYDRNLRHERVNSYLNIHYGHVIRRDISSQIREIMEHEILGKRKKGGPRKLWEECIKKDLERYGLRRQDAYDRVKWREHIKAKIANPGQPGQWN